MEQAHTRLIAQLNERISAADNTPIYMKFAQTVRMPCAAVFLSTVIFCTANAISQLTGVSRIAVRKAMQALEEEGCRHARPWLQYAQINNIFEYSLRKRARGFSQQVVLRGKTGYAMGWQQTRGKLSGWIAQHTAISTQATSLLKHSLC